jgi:hypothetical protein
MNVIQWIISLSLFFVNPLRHMLLKWVCKMLGLNISVGSIYDSTLVSSLSNVFNTDRQALLHYLLAEGRDIFLYYISCGNYNTKDRYDKLRT